MDLDYIFRGIRSLGLRTTLASLRYSWLRDRINRRYRKKDANILRPPGQLLRQETRQDGASFLFQSAELDISFLTQSAVRVTWTPGLDPPPYGLASAQESPPTVKIEQQEKQWWIRSDLLSISVSAKGQVAYFNGDGEQVRREDPPVRRGERWSLRSELTTDEVIYGLGERAAPLNLRPGSYRFWNTDAGGGYQRGEDPLYLCIPLYLSLSPSGSYQIYYENPHEGSASFSGEAKVSFEGGQLRSVFILGEPKECLQQLASLVGEPAMPPRWALGYHHSRWGYRDLEEIAKIVDGFDQHDLPLDVFHLDIDYMDEYRVFTQSAKRFPSLAPLSQELEQKLSAKLVVILDPGVKIDPEYRLYQEGIEQQAFCKLPNGEPMAGVVWPGWVHFPDFTDPAVRRWWGQQYAELVDQGVDGFWHDMNEPTSFAAWGELALPRPTQHVVEGEGGDHRAIHNLYGSLMNRAGFEGLKQLRPDQRPWLLSRSGWAGLCRYAWNWTGDTASTWDMLKTTISTVLGLGLSGIPFSGPDIGGFSGDPSPELYLRWFQLATFMPFFRNHSSKLTQPREPWTYDEEGLRIIRRHLNLRQQFMPYLYTHAEEAHRTGWPMVRPLFWLAPEDQSLWEVDDCFLLGDNLLVAPVLTEGAEERTVQLPPGAWVDYWTDERYQGSAEITVPGPLDRTPLLARAGAVLPHDDDGELVLHLFPPDPAEDEVQSSLYLDAGDGYGPSRLDQFLCQATDHGWRLDWDSMGEYRFPDQQVNLQLHPPLPAVVEIDGQRKLIEGDCLTVVPFKHLESFREK